MTIYEDLSLVVDAVREDKTIRKLLKDGEPYYMYGHRLEISNRLLEKDDDKVYKYQKYPLIALRLPTSIDHKDMDHYSLNIGIFAFTDAKYNSEERIEKVFKPILYPIYQKFLEKLGTVGLFRWPGFQTQPQHTSIDQMFWGIQYEEGSARYIFNDPLDCIEIIGLKINQDKKC